MTIPIPSQRTSAPAKGPTAPRSAFVSRAVVLILLFFGGSMAMVHRLTEERPRASASPAREPELPAVPRSALVETPTGRPVPGPVSPPASSPAAPAIASAAASSIEVSFKLDPRVTRGLHMGDRWVSGPRYTTAAQLGPDVVIEARAHARDASGRAMKEVTPVWTPADPGMVAVSPADRGAVRLTVKRTGQSDVTVASDGAARKLTVAAVQERGIWRIDIAQR